MKKHQIMYLFILLPILFAFINISNKPIGTIRIMPPTVGDIIPDIQMLSIDRKTTYKLSQLRGKIVLVNFWASMVAQCRFENPNIVRAYNKYKGKSFKGGDGFEIYSISLDTDLDKWKNSIERDKLSWKYHVSDLKGYESQAAHDFGVKAMPYNFLIDGQGKVIAINLKGLDLSKKLEELTK